MQVPQRERDQWLGQFAQAAQGFATRLSEIDDELLGLLDRWEALEALVPRN